MPLPYNPDMPVYQDVEALGHEIIPVEDVADLTKAQRVLVEYFKKKTAGKRFANRTDLNPMEIVKYIPNVILFDLVYDAKGAVEDVNFRLFGTEVSDFYGDWTGKSLKGDGLNETHPESNLRLLKEINFILDTNKSITTVTKHYSKDRPFIQIDTLKIPFSQDGDTIDMIFMFFEQSSER